MIKGGPKIVTDGLKVCLDAHDAKSYAGEPTTNFFYRETPRIDNSYSSYVYNSDSTWAANHPDAIRVYNTDGTEISSYVNTGANSGNWNVISHAHWVYDDELKKPVVRMHSIAGYESQWRALSRNLYQNLSQLGLTTGDKFTISWLQKAYVTGVYARAGLYMRNTGGGNGFHAGQATSSDVGQLSSELGKWAHKSKTFTVPSGMNETGYNVGLYMYGHYSPTHQNEILISDVQVETGDYATPSVQGVSSSNSGYWGARSSSQGWTDRTTNGFNGTYPITRATHYRDGEVIMPVSASYIDFDGINDAIILPAASNLFSPDFAWEIWVKSTGLGSGMTTGGLFSTDYGQLMQIDGNGNFRVAVHNYDGASSVPYLNTTFTMSPSLFNGEWRHILVTLGGSTDGTYEIYIDGVKEYNGSVTTGWSGNSNWGTLTARIGQNPNNVYYYLLGQVGLFRLYHKHLTQAEALSNYNATKGRFS